MKKSIAFLFLLGLFIQTKAQFIERGEIEFEVKTNIKKTMGNSAWGEMMQDKLPNFKTSYYTLKFENNKSQYIFNRWENKESLNEMFRSSDEKSEWYTDYNTGNYIMNKDVFGSSFQIKDSIYKIDWKLSNENRIIAGYNCRKAVGKILDSVYVFAFYTDEITIPGGPCTIHGLPGMILGMTIPRLYCSWIATKVTPSDKTTTTPLTEGKVVFNPAKAKETIIEKTKGWMDNSDPESYKWLTMMIWNVLL
ncbi:MAG: hypothetical protein RL582_184 [Bacteroidota bacterium]|jgi:GLPGLI family protein